MVVYTDASQQQTARGGGTKAGMTVQLDDTWWGLTVPLPPEADNTTAELLALAPGRWIGGCLRELGAHVGEWVYDVQAPESLVAECPYPHRDPLRRAI